MSLGSSSILLSPAVPSCAPSAFRQLESRLYSFMALPIASVFVPRSFCYTTPSAFTMNVITPDDRYSAGWVTKATLNPRHSLTPVSDRE
jgi:hypothetical protein